MNFFVAYCKSCQNQESLVTHNKNQEFYRGRSLMPHCLIVTKRSCRTTTLQKGHCILIWNKDLYKTCTQQLSTLLEHHHHLIIPPRRMTVSKYWVQSSSFALFLFVGGGTHEFRYTFIDMCILKPEVKVGCFSWSCVTLLLEAGSLTEYS